MDVHPDIDAYVIMCNLLGEEKFTFEENCNFGKRWDSRKSLLGIYRGFIALYEDKVVFLISSRAKKYFSDFFNSKGIEYKILDYTDSVQFRAKMSPHQIIEFHSNFNNMVKEINDSY